MFMRRLRVVFSNKPARCLLLLLFAVFAMSMEADARSAGGGQRVRAEALFKGFRFPDLAEGFLFSLTSGCYRDGGDGAWDRSGSSSHRLGRSSLPSAFVLELWCPPNPPGSGERQPVSGLAVVSTGRKAACCICVRASSMPIFLFPLGLEPKGRQPCISCSESTVHVVASYWRRWQRGGGPAAPSGVVPGGGGIASVRKMHFGPNCVFTSRPRVLLASFRDLFVIFLFFESCCALCTVTLF